MENCLKKVIEENLGRKLKNNFEFVRVVITVLARKNNNRGTHWKDCIEINDEEYQKLLFIVRSYDDIDIKRLTLAPMVEDILTVLEIYEGEIPTAVIEDIFSLFLLFKDLKKRTFEDVDADLANMYSKYTTSNMWKHKILEEQDFRKIICAIKGYRFNYEITDFSTFGSYDLIDIVNTLKNVFSYSNAQIYKIVADCQKVNSDKDIKSIFPRLSFAAKAVKYMTVFFTKDAFRDIKSAYPLDIFKAVELVGTDKRAMEKRTSVPLKKNDFHISCGPFFSFVLAKKNKGNTLIVNWNPLFYELWNEYFSYEKVYYLYNSKYDKEITKVLADESHVFISLEELSNHLNDIKNIVILYPTQEKPEVIAGIKESISSLDEKAIRLFVYEKNRTKINSEPLYILYANHVDTLMIHPHNPGRDGIYVFWSAELSSPHDTINLIELSDMAHAVDSSGSKELIGYIKGKKVSTSGNDIFTNSLTTILRRSEQGEDSSKWERNNIPFTFLFSKEITVKYTKKSVKFGKKGGKSIPVQCWISLNLPFWMNENEIDSSIESKEDLRNNTYEKPTIKVFGNIRDDIERGLLDKYLYNSRYRIQTAVSDYITETLRYVPIDKKGTISFKTLVYVLTPKIREDKITIPDNFFREIGDVDFLKDKACSEITSDDIRLLKEEYEEKYEGKKEESSLEIILSVLYLIFKQAIWEGYVNSNPLQELNEEELENIEDIASLRKNFKRDSLSFSKAHIAYKKLKADAERTPIGLALFMRLCMFGITPNILASLTWEDIDIGFFEKEGFVCMQICTILNSASKSEGLTNTREYRIVPCGKDLSEILARRKKELEDKYHDGIKSAYVLMYDKKELDEMKTPFPTSSISNESRKFTKKYFNAVDFSISIPTTGNTNEDLDIGKLFGNIFRANFLFHAVKSDLTSDEISYLFGNKCQTTYGRYYWDPFNEISQLKINMKMERIFTSWRGKS